MLHIPDAYRAACDLFLKRTGINPYNYLARELSMASITMYQYQEWNEEGGPLRSLKWEMAVRVTEIFNAKYDAMELPLDFGILRAFNHNVGLLTVEQPRCGSPAGDKAVARTMQEFNDLVQAFVEGGADGRWSREEIERIDLEAFELHQEIEAMKAQAHSLADADAVAPLPRASRVSRKLSSRGVQ